MLRIDNISKSYGKETLFNSASLQLQPHERLGLVGRNGSGKSTIFRMILGEVDPDEGNIIVPSGYRIGHVAQHLDFTKPTLIEEACLGLLPDEIHDVYKAERILFGLGFVEEDLQMPPSSFSGGFQVRLNLAKVLVSNPNLLLLDEPTNYLDIVSIRWIIKFLKSWKHEMILISHDREFMDSVTTHTAIIHRKKIRKMEGDTGKLYAQIAQDEEVYEKTRQNEEKQRKHMEAFVERFRAQASKAAVVQSRIKLMEKLPPLTELENIVDLEFSFQYAPIQAKKLLEVSNLTFGYGDKPPLISNFNMIINSKDRIGIIGRNGRGKSTLAKLLAGELTPGEGSINLHQLTKLGYFGQTNIDRLNGNNSVEDEIGSANGILGRTAVKSICGCMMFSGELSEKKIKVLSGGEKSRVTLGRIIASPTNLLLLDEPTNHLDMQSIDALVTALQEYEGTVIIVTHSELILRSVATKLLIFQDGNVSWFNGNYDEFLEKVGWHDEFEASAKPSGEKQNSKKLLRQNRAALITERSQKLKPLQEEIKKLEEKIMRMEAEEAKVNAELELAAHNQNAAEMAELSKNAKTLKDEIDSCFKRLEATTAKYEPLAAEYAKKLEELS